MTAPAGGEKTSSAIKEWVIAMIAQMLSRRGRNRVACMMIVYETIDGNIRSLTFPDVRAVQDGFIHRLNRENPS